ncbi:MAG: hypothetical protein JKY65_31990 [Planctomycetes bacterium]|nr:hypothetical protein [Planctomycetota bacterium]
MLSPIRGPNPKPVQSVGGPQPIGVEGSADSPIRSAPSSKPPSEVPIESSALGKSLRSEAATPPLRPEALEAGRAVLESGFFHSSDGIAAIADALLNEEPVV